MYHRHSMLPTVALLWGLVSISNAAAAVPITGSMQATSSLGQLLALKMTITNATTTFELTGPDYSYFAFGFDTTSMQGYSLIIEGLDDVRTVVEQNMLGRGNPGSPQSIQNLTVLDISHDALNDLTTLVIKRANQTGDPEDPDFSTALTSLDVIWAYAVTATPENPNGALSYHGPGGRGFATLTFAPIPEPASALLLVPGSLLLLMRRLRSSQR